MWYYIIDIPGIDGGDVEMMVHECASHTDYHVQDDNGYHCTFCGIQCRNDEVDPAQAGLISSIIDL